MDYNTRLVMIGSAMLGAVCGLVGVYLLLRKRSLIGDAICHASLPGIALGFFASLAMGGNGRDAVWLLGGAAVSGVVGALTVLGIRRWTLLKDDAALGIVLSVFFGVGMALLSLVQQTGEGNAAGIEGFIYGNTAGIMANDNRLLALACGCVALTLLLLRKELQLLCFDSAFAASQGWPTVAMDLILLACIEIVVILGTSIVGVLLIIAMVVIPPASARFWSDRLPANLILSASLGTAAGVLGALSSFVIDRVPSGAAMVLIAATLFALSMVFGSKHGFLWRAIRLRRLRYQAEEEHALRAMYEYLDRAKVPPEKHGAVRSAPISLSELPRIQAWGERRVRSVLRRLERSGWVVPQTSAQGERRVVLTASGIRQSVRATQRHRLLELYFARWAELSPDAIDRSADYTEHALDDELLAKLERDALEIGRPVDLPPSIHPV